MSAMIAKRSILAARPATRAVAKSMPRGLFVRPSVVVQKKLIARAESESSESSGIDTEKLVKDVQEKFDSIENKPQFALYVVGGILGLFLTSQLLGFVNKLPLLPKLFELVGLSYTAWFTYNYLLFKSGRQELLQDIEALQSKLSGEEDTPAPAATPPAPVATPSLASTPAPAATKAE
eukprot:gene27435-4736_t